MSKPQTKPRRSLDGIVRHYRVDGYAMVPVEVSVKVQANSEQEAIARAEKLSRHNLRQGIVSNSMDECSVHDFRANHVFELGLPNTTMSCTAPKEDA